MAGQSSHRFMCCYKKVKNNEPLQLANGCKKGKHCSEHHENYPYAAYTTFIKKEVRRRLYHTYQESMSAASCVRAPVVHVYVYLIHFWRNFLSGLPTTKSGRWEGIAVGH